MTSCVSISMLTSECLLFQTPWFCQYNAALSRQRILRVLLKLVDSFQPALGTQASSKVFVHALTGDSASTTAMQTVCMQAQQPPPGYPTSVGMQQEGQETAGGPEESRDKGLLSNIMHSISGDHCCVTDWQQYQRHKRRGDAEPICRPASLLL